ncbi:hypothetical protein TW95_gp0199 [Pandoravirus inopinatum]|uniref:Uncharacterized protein n=1 Tax=Pandoravirus inopinatum TaxID=1605721 RepID=A0A0B5IW69_9VIRU|nr:hypothetical protein TW95_gp0199 [Pandoravirus inopinatum]AJF96933.1 hypothetical protein [Pandoravirus inopinatum]
MEIFAPGLESTLAEPRRVGGGSWGGSGGDARPAVVPGSSMADRSRRDGMHDAPTRDGGGEDGASHTRGNGADDENQVATLIARVDPGRLRQATLLGRCFEVLVPVERLCVAFARQTREAPWSDCSPLAEALRAHMGFADASKALQAAVARVPLGGTDTPAYVACCGCSRPWCSGRPCATGWMRPVDPRACRRLLAWQWAEHGVRGLNPDAAFGGFYERELVQCVEPDAGHRLASCRRRRDAADDPPIAATASKRHCRRVPSLQAGAGTDANTDNADTGGKLAHDHNAYGDMIDGTVGLDGTDYDNDGGGDSHPLLQEHIHGPLLLSCGPRCVITIRDAAVYAGALGASCRRGLDEMVHPSQAALRGRVASGTGAVERWVRVVGDAFIVRVHLPAHDAIPWDAHG